MGGAHLPGQVQPTLHYVDDDGLCRAAHYARLKRRQTDGTGTENCNRLTGLHLALFRGLQSHGKRLEHRSVHVTCIIRQLIGKIRRYRRKLRKKTVIMGYAVKDNARAEMVFTSLAVGATPTGNTRLNRHPVANF